MYKKISSLLRVWALISFGVANFFPFKQQFGLLRDTKKWFSNPLVCHSMILVRRYLCFGKKSETRVKWPSAERNFEWYIDPNNFYTLITYGAFDLSCQILRIKESLLLNARDRETRIFLHLPLLNKILYLIETGCIVRAAHSHVTGPLIWKLFSEETRTTRLTFATRFRKVRLWIFKIRRDVALQQLTDIVCDTEKFKIWTGSEIEPYDD